MVIQLQSNPYQPGIPERISFPCLAAQVWCLVDPYQIWVGDIYLTSAGWRLTLITADGGQFDPDLRMVRGYYPTLLDAALAAICSEDFVARSLGAVYP